MKRTCSLLACAALAASSTLACSGRDSGESSTSDGLNSNSDDDSDEETQDDGPRLDVEGDDTDTDHDPDEEGDCEGEDPPNPDAHLIGTVYAPNLEVPISGALVYLTYGDPEPVPPNVYCAECVELPCDAHFVLTEPDGSFNLPAVAGPGQKLVVQKGQFLRIREFDVEEGDNAVPAFDSSLPGQWNPPNGEYIPRMAVMSTWNDSIYNVLGKIGLGDMDGSGELIPGQSSFDVYEGNGGALLDDLDAMRSYHIIFIPCMSQGSLGIITPARLANIRQWVDEGGKWYVTDWANEYLYQPFPTYQDFHSPASPDLGYYDSDATILDPDLLAWLQALPAPLKDIGAGFPNLNSLPGVQIVDNWSGIDAIHDIVVQNDEGEDVHVGHHPWVEGPCLACTPSNVRPMTISAQYGCGRMMFSTYHTNEGAHLGLTPQELILFYIILEIGVCHGEPPPPPPPQG